MYGEYQIVAPGGIGLRVVRVMAVLRLSGMAAKGLQIGRSGMLVAVLLNLNELNAELELRSLLCSVPTVLWCSCTNCFCCGWDVHHGIVVLPKGYYCMVPGHTVSSVVTDCTWIVISLFCSSVWLHDSWASGVCC